MWGLDHKESWTPKNWWFRIVVLEKTLESLLDCKEIQPVHPKVNQSWILIGRTDAEAETPILWPTDVKYWLIGRDPDAGKDWKWEEKGTTEDEMVGWHHCLNRHEFESTLGVSDVQGGLMCCDSWGHKELDTAEWMNWLSWCSLMLIFINIIFLGYVSPGKGNKSKNKQVGLCQTIIKIFAHWRKLSAKQKGCILNGQSLQMMYPIRH